MTGKYCHITDDNYNFIYNNITSKFGIAPATEWTGVLNNKNYAYA